MDGESDVSNRRYEQKSHGFSVNHVTSLCSAFVPKSAVYKLL